MESSCNKTPSLATDVFGCFDLCLTRDRSFDLFSKLQLCTGSLSESETLRAALILDVNPEYFFFIISNSVSTFSILSGQLPQLMLTGKYLTPLSVTSVSSFTTTSITFALLTDLSHSLSSSLDLFHGER